MMQWIKGIRNGNGQRGSVSLAVALAASTVTGLDYSTLFSGLQSEVTLAIAGVATAGVAIFAAKYALRMVKTVFKTLAR